MSVSQETAPAQEQQEQQERAARSKVATRLLNQPLRNLGAGVAIIVLGSTAAFGGLKRSDPASRLAPVRVGVKTQVAPYDIRINKVVWADSLPNVYPVEKGDRWLAITATVRNTDTTSLVNLSDSLTLSGVDGLVQKPDAGTDRVRSTYQKVLADSSDLDPVQPGINYDMVFLFEQKAASTPPRQVTVELVNHTWRQDSIDKTSKWLDPTVIARSTLPMAESATAKRASSTPAAT
jgi:hypothetical protein